MKSFISHICLATLVLIYSCKNRRINEDAAFQTREIHENIAFQFDKVNVDGVEYLILEKDNNNPHEGFGFMAFRANKLMEKQDTVIALLKTIKDIEASTYQIISRKSKEEVTSEVDSIFSSYLKAESSDLKSLEQSNLQSELKD